MKEDSVTRRLQAQLEVALRDRDEYKTRALRAEARADSRLRDDLWKSRTDHLDRFFCHTARARLVNLFPNAKEVTESVGAFHAVNQHLMIDRSDSNVTAIVVGDGHSPRTGALIALSTNWNVWSIDPVLKTKYRGVSERLTLVDAKIEDSPGWNLPDKRVVIVAVHSHARLQDAVRKVRACARLDAVSIPCCVKQHVMYLDSEGDDTVVPVPPDVTYEDGAILSPERTVLVWKNIETKIRDQHALAKLGRALAAMATGKSMACAHHVVGDGVTAEFSLVDHHDYAAKREAGAVDMVKGLARALYNLLWRLRDIADERHDTSLRSHCVAALDHLARSSRHDEQRPCYDHRSLAAAVFAATYAAGLNGGAASCGHAILAVVEACRAFDPPEPPMPENVALAQTGT